MLGAKPARVETAASSPRPTCAVGSGGCASVGGKVGSVVDPRRSRTAEVSDRAPPFNPPGAPTLTCLLAEWFKCCFGGRADPRSGRLRPHLNGPRGGERRRLVDFTAGARGGCLRISGGRESAAMGARAPPLRTEAVVLRADRDVHGRSFAHAQRGWLVDVLNVLDRESRQARAGANVSHSPPPGQANFARRGGGPRAGA